MKIFSRYNVWKVKFGMHSVRNYKFRTTKGSVFLHPYEIYFRCKYNLNTKKGDMNFMKIKNFIIRIVFTIILIGLICDYKVNAVDEFVLTKDMSLSSNFLNNISFLDGLYIAVGTDGIIKTSKDSIKWDIQFTNSNQNLMGTVLKDGEFIVVGYGGAILSSKDGTNWENKGDENKYNLTKVVSNGSKVIAVGFDNTILQLSDDYRWEKHVAGSIGCDFFEAISDGKKFIISGRKMVTENVIIATSEDGANWSFNELPYKGTIEEMWVSDNKYFALIEDKLIYLLFTSEDGINWNHKKNANTDNMNPLRSLIDDVIWDGKQYVGISNYFGGALYGAIITSDDQKTWKERGNNFCKSFRCISTNGNIFVAGGFGGALYTSTDGYLWVKHDMGTIENFSDIVWNGRVFIAIGSYGTIFTSSDGDLWIKRNSGSVVDLLGITCAENKIIVAGRETVLVSINDGESWKVLNVPELKYCAGISSSESHIVAISQSGEVCVSEDGYNWEKSNLPAMVNIDDVAWGKDRFIAVGYRIGKTLNVGAEMFPLVFTSYDGYNWSNIEFGNDKPRFNAIIWDGRQFVAVGYGDVATSTDGDSWETYGSITTDKLNDVASNGKFCVGVGDTGTLITGRYKIPIGDIENQVILQINNPYMIVNGVLKEINPGNATSPIIKENRTLLPIRALIESIGGTVEWNDNERTITILHNFNKLKLSIGSNKTIVNGSEKVIDVVPQIVNGRTMIPFRYVMENIGLNIKWNGDTRKISINY